MFIYEYESNCNLSSQQSAMLQILIVNVYLHDVFGQSQICFWGTKKGEYLIKKLGTLCNVSTSTFLCQIDYTHQSDLLT